MTTLILFSGAGLAILVAIDLGHWLWHWRSDRAANKRFRAMGRYDDR